ncbi:MAG: YidH family protein [Methylocystis sp.]|jgi:putative membrane protein
MIRDYANIAANERTYLAWVRTGIAVIGLGFVIERFNLFLTAVAAGAGAEMSALRIHRLESAAGKHGGTLLIAAGVALVVLATVRFLQTTRLLEKEEAHRPQATHPTLLALSALILAVAGFAAYLAVG